MTATERPASPTDAVSTRPAKPSSARRLLPALMGAGIGVAMAAGGLQVGSALARNRRSAGVEGLHLTDREEWALLIIAVVAMFSTLVAHELGHLLGGRMVGFRAFLFIVGPLRMQKAASGWTASLNRSFALAGGLAGSAPQDAHNLRRRMAVMIAGGPVTSLVTGAVSLLACLALDPFAFTATTPRMLVLLAGALAAYGIMSIGIGCVTLIPGTTSGFRTDGAQLLRYLRGGPDAERAAASAAIVGLSLGGTRPRDFPPALVNALDTHADGSMEEVYAWQLQQMVAADRGDVSEARALLDQIVQHVDRMPSMTVATVYYDAAAQYARFGDAVKARAMLSAADNRPAFGADYLPPLARGAVHALSGDGGAAHRELAEARTLLSRCMVPGSIAPTRELIAEFERMLDGRTPQR